jgi:hypothetical protein
MVRVVSTTPTLRSTVPSREELHLGAFRGVERRGLWQLREDDAPIRRHDAEQRRLRADGPSQDAVALGDHAVDGRAQRHDRRAHVPVAGLGGAQASQHGLRGEEIGAGCRVFGARLVDRRFARGRLPLEIDLPRESARGQRGATTGTQEIGLRVPHVGRLDEGHDLALLHGIAKGHGERRDPPGHERGDLRLAGLRGLHFAGNGRASLRCARGERVDDDATVVQERGIDRDGGFACVDDGRWRDGRIGAACACDREDEREQESAFHGCLHGMRPMARP